MSPPGGSPYPQADSPYPQTRQDGQQPTRNGYQYPLAGNQHFQTGNTYPQYGNQQPPNGSRHVQSGNRYSQNGNQEPPQNGYQRPEPPPHRPVQRSPGAGQHRKPGSWLRITTSQPAASWLRATTSQPALDDDSYASSQVAGLAALMAISEPETVLVPFSGPIVRPRYTSPLQRLDERTYEPTASPSERGGGWRARIASLRTDNMMRSALYLILSTGIQAVFGFAFWIVTAHLFSTDAVGQASSLISATTLIGFFGLLGLNTTFIRFLSATRDRRSLITAGLSVVGICSGVLALGYAMLTPVIAPHIAFIAHSPMMTIGFMILTAAGSMNVLTDAVFIAADRAVYTAWTDGIIGGVTRMVAVVAVSGAGAYGIFSASAAGQLTGVVASLILIARILGWRPRIRNLRQTLAPVFQFSGANYIANTFNMLPILVIPLIVLDRLGSSEAAYYYVAYQLASLLYQAVFAVEQSFLAEGAHSGTITRAFLMRSVRILLMLCIPGFILMVLLSHWMLLIFGAKYESNAVGCLIALSIAVIPIAANNWLLTVLRLANQLKATMISNFCYAAAICGLAWFLAPRGLTSLALAWPIGVSLGSVVAGIAAVHGMRQQRKRRSADVGPDRRTFLGSQA